MGIDYESVAGWGVSIGRDDLTKALNIDEDGDWMGVLDERSPVGYETFGSYYSGDLWAAFVDPDPSEIPARLEEINEALGTSFTYGDIEFISEVCCS